MDKRLKPNLVDPIIQQKIINTLNPPKEDYWGPTKTTIYDFTNNYIIPNILFIIVLIIVGIILFYRYRITQKEKEKTQLDTYPDIQPNTDQQLASKLAMEMYTQQKEQMREPTKQKPSFAYPMYPYSKSGNLVPGNSR